MSRIPIVMPQLGESIAEASIRAILVSPGDSVEEDDAIMEVETNKAVMDISAVCSGTIVSLDAAEGETIPVGGILGYIETEEDAADAPAPAPQAESPAAAPEPAAPAPAADAPAPMPALPPMPEGGLPVPLRTQGKAYFSPRVQARMDQLGITEADLTYIIGSGENGRITVQDFEKFIKYIDCWPSDKASSMRRSMADSMLRTWRRPIANAARSICISPIQEHRKQHPRHPGSTLYFVRALGLALAERPECAGFMVGSRIITPKHIDIGIAIGVTDGITVPVLRNVNECTLDELADEYDKVVSMARVRRIDPKYQGGGVATISNYGAFGLTDANPLPLPSESLIIGVGSVTKNPVWSDKENRFLPVEQVRISASFDHRVVDGGGIGRMMRRLAHYLEHPELL